MKITEIFGLEPRKAVDEASVALFGIECEIESVDRDNTSFLKLPGVSVQDDNSLRNYGVELVWKAPRTLADSLVIFEKIHQNLAFYNKDQRFSERTSTHVHMNVRNLTDEQALTLVHLYILFEECFFLHAEPSRRENIFCMPLTETHLPSIYNHHHIVEYFQRWSKYTALNLKRMGDLGTIEFRHLHGTDSVEELRGWLTTLENLFVLCQKTEISLELLGDEAAVTKLADQLFSHNKKYQLVRNNLFSFIENSLIDLKLSFI